MKKPKPIGEMVLVKFNEVKKPDLFKANKHGILLPTETPNQEGGSKPKFEAVIHSVGDKIEIDKVAWKVGDKIIFNEYDMMKLQDDDGEIWGLTKVSSIWAVYE